MSQIKDFYRTYSSINEIPYNLSDNPWNFPFILFSQETTAGYADDPRKLLIGRFWQMTPWVGPKSSTRGGSSEKKTSEMRGKGQRGQEQTTQPMLLSLRSSPTFNVGVTGPD